MSSKMWVILGIAAVLLVALSWCVPWRLRDLGMAPDAISAYGAWIAAGVVAAVGLLAVPQLAAAKRSIDADVFLKICAEIDDETFGKNYERCRRDRARFSGVTIAEGKTLRFTGNDSPELRDAAMDVLYTLEAVGIIFHYSALNKEMIAEYIGDVAANSYVALKPVIEAYQAVDKTAFDRTVELRNYCIAHGWQEELAASFPFTRIR